MDALARRLLTLWEEQWTALAADPEMAEAAGRMNAMMGEALAAFSAPLNAAAGRDGAGTIIPFAGPPPGAAPAAPAHDAVADALVRLEGRLAGIERRLDELAAKLGDGGAEPKGRPAGGRRRRDPA
ncbi:MAG TPA: hypothetical protein VEH84_16765 [Alphaproteobacteria bacterium]|nr:hypothetical protein [Alphaproteobacteria bacterium]